MITSELALYKKHNGLDLEILERHNNAEKHKPIVILLIDELIDRLIEHT